jgi:Sec-independent protein translocase protein TatA
VLAVRRRVLLLLAVLMLLLLLPRHLRGAAAGLASGLRRTRTGGTAQERLL